MEQLLQALAAPRRREILQLLRRRERSAGEIHRALGAVTFGAVSQHLGVLEHAGLVSARREGRSRFYATRAEGLQPLREWLDEMWDDALARLERPRPRRRARREAGRSARALAAARAGRRPQRARGGEKR